MLRVYGSLISILIALPAFSQIPNNAADVSGGYALSRGSGRTAQGWYADVSGQLHRSLYAVVTLSGTYFSQTATLQGTTITANASTYNFTGGPRVFIRRHRMVSPFVDIMVGGFHSGVDVGVLGTFAQASVNGFRLTSGGGADFRMSDTLSVRLRPAWAHARANGMSGNRFILFAGIALHLGD